MSDTTPGSFLKKYFQERFLFLLISILALMVLSPVLDGLISLWILKNTFMAIIFVCCILAVSNTRRAVYITVALSVPMFIAIFVPGIENPPGVEDAPMLAIAGNLSGIVFIAAIIVLTLSFIFKSREVNANIIYASIVTYLLLGIMWIFIYQAIEIFQPGSFTIPEHITVTGGDLTTYYSFVTLTTLGYGDVTPVGDVARAFAILEAVIGQIFLVVLVARLVGLNIAQTMDKDRKRD